VFHINCTVIYVLHCSAVGMVDTFIRRITRYMSSAMPIVMLLLLLLISLVIHCFEYEKNEYDFMQSSSIHAILFIYYIACTNVYLLLYLLLYFTIVIVKLIYVSVIHGAC
jgi:hypothetical protein